VQVWSGPVAAAQRETMAITADACHFLALLNAGPGDQVVNFSRARLAGFGDHKNALLGLNPGQ
jgi:hypothetical protein